MADLRFERTERMIQLTFLNMLETMTLNEISIAQLAKDSLIDRTTFYAHYDNIYELAKTLIDRNIDPFIVAFSEAERKRRWEKNFDSYSFFTEKLVDYLINHRQELLQIRSLPLGSNSFDQRLRHLLTEVYVNMTHFSKKDFAIYLLVNLAMSDLDFIFENRRIPSKLEMLQGLEKIEDFLN